MEFVEKIKECYEHGKQLWILTERPKTCLKYLIIEKLRDFSPYKLSKITSFRTPSEQILDLTLPDWFLMPEVLMIDYSKMPTYARKMIPKVVWDRGEGFVSFGIPKFIFKS
mgnify:CR=1 FL=1